MFRFATPFVKQINNVVFNFSTKNLSTLSDSLALSVKKNNANSFWFKPKSNKNPKPDSPLNFLTLVPKTNKFIQKLEGSGELYDYSLIHSDQWPNFCQDAQKKGCHILVVTAKKDGVLNILRSKQSIPSSLCFKYKADFKHIEVLQQIVSLRLSDKVWWHEHYMFSPNKRPAQQILSEKTNVSNKVTTPSMA